MPGWVGPEKKQKAHIWGHIDHSSRLVGWLEFNIPFQHKYAYIKDERSGVES